MIDDCSSRCSTVSFVAASLASSMVARALLRASGRLPKTYFGRKGSSGMLLPASPGASMCTLGRGTSRCSGSGRRGLVAPWVTSIASSFLGSAWLAWLPSSGVGSLRAPGVGAIVSVAAGAFLATCFVVLDCRGFRDCGRSPCRGSSLPLVAAPLWLAGA